MTSIGASGTAVVDHVDPPPVGELPDRAEYQRRYDLIAHDYLQHYRDTGANKWMSDEPDLRAWTIRHIRTHVPPPARVLDAGCGLGLLMRDLAGEYVISGVEIVPELVEYARAQGSDAQIAWLEQLPFDDNMFDAILCVDVLEHVIDPGAVARELNRVLRPGGVYVVRIPQLAYVNIGGTGDYDFPIHLNAFHQDSLAELLNATLLHVEAYHEELLVILEGDT